MDFGAVLDEWDRLQKESKRKVCGGNPVSGKKANAPEKSKTPSNYSEAGNGFAKRIDPQEAWLRRYGVVDKDKIAAEEAERDRERSQRYVKDMPIEARIDLHGLTQDEARSRLVVFVGVTAFIAFLSEGAMMDWSGVYLTTVRGMDLSLAGMGFSVFSAAMLLMRFLGDRVVQRIGQCPVAVGGALLTFAGILLVMFAPVDALLYLGFFAIGIGSANIVPVFFSLMGRQNVMPIGTAVSAVSTMGYLGILAGPAAIGFVSALTNLQTAFGMLAALSLLQALVSFYVFRKMV